MRRILATLLSSLALAAVGSVGAPAAQAKWSPPPAAGASVKTSPYVALGDSYASAAGVLPQVPGAPAGCSRSLLNFAHDIAAATGARSFVDVTCAGARTADFFAAQQPGVAPQLDAVSADTRLVTMTIGGNDGGLFGSLLGACIQASLQTHDITGNPCEQKYGPMFQTIIDSQTYPNVRHALAAVRAKAPRATVVILGYPRILPDSGILACYPSMPFSMGDVPYAAGVERALNAAIARAARDEGARFVDMWPSSRGHDACQAPSRRWVEPFVNPVGAQPVHPNAVGEAAMAWQTIQQLRLRPWWQRAA